MVTVGNNNGTGLPTLGGIDQFSSLSRLLFKSFHGGRACRYNCYHPGSYYRITKTNILNKTEELIDLFGLSKFVREPAANLSYGDQRRVEIARALATQPTLLLLDEPAAGLNIAETDALVDLIHHIRNHYGLTIFLVEHDIKLIMTVCDRIQVIDQGKPIASGLPDEIRNNSRVIEAYLGNSNGFRHVENR